MKKKVIIPRNGAPLFFSQTYAHLRFLPATTFISPAQPPAAGQRILRGSQNSQNILFTIGFSDKDKMARTKKIARKNGYGNKPTKQLKTEIARREPPIKIEGLKPNLARREPLINLEEDVENPDSVNAEMDVDLDHCEDDSDTEDYTFKTYVAKNPWKPATTSSAPAPVQDEDDSEIKNFIRVETRLI